MVLFKHSAKYQDPDSRYYLGVMYLKGLGIQKNLKGALRMFTLAAEANHLAAVFQLARMHHHGIGTTQNPLVVSLNQCLKILTYREGGSP
jgi:TPR repeat protein